MPSIFKRPFLDHNKQSSRDQADRAVKIISPMSWIALTGVALVLLVVVLWAFMGSLPATVTAPGYLVSRSAGTNTVTSDCSGRVKSILVQPGTLVHQGQEIMRLVPAQGGTDSDAISVTSDQYGYVQEILVSIGQTVNNGADLLRISPAVSMGQQEVVVAYVPLNEVGMLVTAMQDDHDLEAQVTLNAADSGTYGHMTGRVINIDSRATTSAGIESVVGTDNGLSGLLMADGAVCAVTCELWPDSASSNGYLWSNQRGRSWQQTPNAACTVYIVTRREAPIARFFTGLRGLMGGR